MYQLPFVLLCITPLFAQDEGWLAVDSEHPQNGSVYADARITIPPLEEEFPWGWRGIRAEPYPSPNFTNPTICMTLQQFDGNWSEVSQIFCQDVRLRKSVELKIPIDIAESNIFNPSAEHRFALAFDLDAPVAVSIELTFLGPIGFAQVYIALVLLIGTYVLVVFEFVSRTLVVLAAAFISFFFLILEKNPPHLERVATWLDEGTIVLLFGMMVIVHVTTKTGFFEFLAVRCYQFSRGSVRLLVVTLCVLVAILSAFLDNVTTVLLIVPVTLKVCEVLDLDPEPVVIAEALMSNIGGTATLIGDPPNIIIGNLLKDEVSFVDFIINLGPAVVLVSIAVLCFLLGYYRNEINGHRKLDVDDLVKEYPIKDKILFYKCSAVVGIVMLLFFFHSLTGMEPAYAAVLGAVTLLFLTNHKDIREVLKGIEWDTLLFFSGLFLLVEALREMGLIDAIGAVLSGIIASVPESSRLIVALTLLLWTSAIVSAFVNNVPYAATMVPVIKALAENPELNLPLPPLVWALALGTCLGGNGTLVGASANVVVADLSKKETTITFIRFFKVGFPTMIISMLVCNVYLLAVYVGILGE